MRGRTSRQGSRTALPVSDSTAIATLVTSPVANCLSTVQSAILRCRFATGQPVSTATVIDMRHTGARPQRVLDAARHRATGEPSDTDLQSPARDSLSGDAPGLAIFF